MVQKKDHSQLIIWFRISIFLFLSLIVWQLGVQPARAETRTICQSGGCDFSIIQTAIDGSNIGDILEFNPFNSANEIYEETITINKSLTFVGQNTIINAQDGGTAVTITGSPTVDMQNMIIQNGIGNNGAGLFMNGGNLTLTNVSFNGNDASNQGGALYILSGSAELIDVTMQLNTAVSGGAIYNNGTLTADNLTLSDNSADDGGGLYNNGTTTIDSQATIQRNEATGSGGGVFNASGNNFTLLNSDVSNNDAADGAGIFNEGILQITNTNIGSSNTAVQSGGGIYNTGQATLTNSTVVQNEGDTGAGIYNAGTLIANNSTISRNVGPNGAGLYNMSGTATLNNVTIHLTNGTSLFADGGTVTVGNTIISSALGLPACGGGGTAVSNGYNLSIDQTCTFLTATGDLQGVNPNLNSITSPADGAAYHSPKLTSPVIDAGNPATPGSGGTACLANDQRGLARPQNMRCDIGAVEIVVYRVYIPLAIK